MSVSLILINFATTEKEGQWRFILLTGGVIGLVQSVGLLFLPESPFSLVASGDIEQARKELIKIRGTLDVEQELAGYRNQNTGKSLVISLPWASPPWSMLADTYVR